MDDFAIAEYLNSRRIPTNCVPWKVLAGELGMTISQLEYWRRQNGWVDRYPTNQVLSRRSLLTEVNDEDIESSLDRGLLANLPLSTILTSMPVDMDRYQLFRWRRSHEYEDPRRHLDDDELDCMVREITECRPNTGEVMVRSYLAASGVAVTREDLRESLRLVDPLGR